MSAFEITEYDEIKAGIETVKEQANFLPDVTTDEGYEKSKRVSLDIGKLLTSLEKKRQEKKRYFLDGGKEVDSQAKAIAKQLEEIQEPHKLAYKELDKLRKEREARRKAELEERVFYMHNLPAMMADSCSEEVMGALTELQGEECLDFYEFTEQALKARNTSREELKSLFARKQKEEAEAAELAKLRAEAAEREKRDREEAIRKEAAAKAEKEKAEAEERERQAKQEAEQAEARAKQAAENAERQAKEAAERARREEMERQEAERAEQKRQEDARLANKRHIGKVRKEAKEDLMDLGIIESEAKRIVMAINNGTVRNITINY